ncbi:ABC transporter transmembrane domain-containing protein [Phormidesmis priestleyi]
MNSVAKLRVPLQPQFLETILKLLSLGQANQTVEAFGQAFEIEEFQLGDLLDPADDRKDTVNSTATPIDNSGGSEPKRKNFYLVCEGRVRLLCLDSQRQRDVSALVLEAGETFGGEDQFCQMPLPYRAIAASSVKLARMSLITLETWLEKLPQLRETLEQQAQQRERLIFFKTCAASGSDSSAAKPLTSDQVQQLLPYLVEVRVAAGESLAQVAAAGHCWLRQGEIRRQDGQLVAIGDRFGYPDSTQVEWIAETDLVLYQLPIAHWDGATTIAPTQFVKPDVALPTLKPSRRKKLRSSLSDFQTTEPDQLPGQPIGGKAKFAAPPVVFPKPKKYRRLSGLWQGYPFIQQQSSSDCGVACLAMIGQYWGKRFSLNSLRNLAKVGRSGASLKHLSEAAEMIGFHASPVRASWERLAEQKNPWVAHWQGDHYVVVYRVTKNWFLVADPARGKRKLSREIFLSNWTGYALLLDPTDRLNNTETDRRSLGKFGGLLWSYRSLLWQIVGISLLIQLFGLVTPLFTQVILDRVVTEKSLVTLNVFAIGLLLFSVWRVAMMTIRQYLLDYFSNRLDLTLISGFISHALTLPLKFFESRQVGDILTRVQENQKIQNFLTRHAVSTWLDALMAIVYLGLMFYYNWRLTLLVIGMIPPIILLTLGATPFLRKVSREIFNEAADQNSILVEMMTGIATVKATAAEREVRWRWEDKLTSTINAQFRGQKLANGLQGTSELINAIGSTALLWYGATLVIQEQLTIGQFVAFNMLIGSVITPVLSLVRLWDEFQEVLISVERLNDVFTATPEESASRPMLVLPAIQGEIRFENVTFHYEQADETNVLQNLSFVAEVGETIAIVGRSGSGKSTLVKLLQGLYSPSNGRILIDGHDLHHVSPQSFRPQLGVVPQECFLFSGTILENIQLYRSDFTLDEVIKVAKLAEAHSFIQDLTLGYNTKVGERGSNLSGGQRQRIAIARALLGDPAILILDEATSSLDTESERRFQQNLAHISRGRTTFIIAHRLSTVRHVDRILVLDRGVLVEQGTHDELIALQGLYCHLAQQQLDL